MQDTKRRPHRPPLPPRPPGRPARPPGPKPFPHPPRPPAPPGAGAGLGGAKAALGRLGRRNPLIGGALLLWWLWDALGPLLPVPPPPADGRPGRWEVWTTHENCTNFAVGRCFAWGGSTFEVLEQTFPFNGEVPTAYWIGERLSGDGEWRLERRTWSADGKMTVLNDVYVGKQQATAATRPVSVRLAKTYTDGSPDPDPDAPWRRPVFPFDPFDPRRDPGRPRDFPWPEPEADPRRPAPARPVRPAPRPDPPLQPEPPPVPDPARPAPAPRPPSPPPWAPSAPPHAPPASPPGRARPVRPPIRPPAPGRGDPSQPQPDPPGDAVVGDPIKPPRPAPLIRPERVGPVIGPDGLPQPEVQEAPVTQTPKEAHVIGGELVEGIGGGPRADLPGIATELGRVERKLELLLLRGTGGSGSCKFNDAKLDEIIEMLDSLQFDVDELSTREEPKLGPLVYTVEAPADYDISGNRETFVFDIPRLPASEFMSLYLRRQAEYQHRLKIWRNHVAKRETNPKPIRIEWEEIPFSEDG